MWRLYWHITDGYWKDDSLNIDIGDWEESGMAALIHEILPEFDDYGNNRIDEELWKCIEKAAGIKDGDVKSVVEEVRIWCEQNFKMNKEFYIMGV